MKRFLFLVLAIIFVASISAPSVSYAKKNGQPAFHVSDRAKGNTTHKSWGKNEGKKHKSIRKGKKGATPATPAIPTPGVPGTTPAIPATPPDPGK